MARPKRNDQFAREADKARRTFSARDRENKRRLRAKQFRLAARIKIEIADLERKLRTTSDEEERILLKAEIAHLRMMRINLSAKPGRKPPEAGIPVPAIPPNGPVPKQGGAEAPLDFKG